MKRAQRARTNKNAVNNPQATKGGRVGSKLQSTKDHDRHPNDIERTQDESVGIHCAPPHDETDNRYLPAPCDEYDDIVMEWLSGAQEKHNSFARNITFSRIHFALASPQRTSIESMVFC